MNEEALFNQAKICLEQGDYEQAIALLEQCIEQNEQEIKFYWYLGLAHLLKGNQDKAQHIWLSRFFQKTHQEIHRWIFYLMPILNAYVIKLISQKDNLVQINFPKDFSVELVEDSVARILKKLFEDSKYEVIVDFCNELIDYNLVSDRIYFWLGNAFRRLKSDDQAIRCYFQAIAINAENPDYFYNLVESYQSTGAIEIAKTTSEQAIMNFSEDILLLYQNYLLLPIVYSSQEQQDIFFLYRQESFKRLRASINLNSQQECLNAAFVIGLNSDFLSCYQGRNDLELWKKHGKLNSQIMSIAYPHLHFKNRKEYGKSDKKQNKKIKLGYVSQNLRDQTIGRYFLGWIQFHNSKEFEIYCYYPNLISDHYTDKFQDFSDYFYFLPPDVESVSQRILEDDLDILVYLDIGMEALMTQLSALRLAPVQCCAWGHPVTTACPMIDYFISCEIMEPNNKQEHYSEKLICLPGLGIIYEPQPFAEKTKNKLSHQDFNLVQDNIIYVSCQSIFKYYPKFDIIFPKIAAQVGPARFIFFEWQGHRNISDIFKTRLEKVFLEYQLNYRDFCLFLPRLSMEDYFAVLNLADIFLDTCEWSGGNTTLDALACALPVVTYPGEYMRGRQSYGMLKLMNMDELIANNSEDYIKKAARLGLDLNWKHRVKEMLKTRFNRLAHDHSCLLELEEALKKNVCK
jgi:predicted O-linked N-acetylglucosamine transferase (SPINDLY family)